MLSVWLRRAHTLEQKDGEQPVMQASVVQNDSPVHTGQHVPGDPGHEINSVSSRPTPDDSRCHDEAVRAEAAAVQAKYTSHVDTTTEVVVRFDFMSEQDTRVRVSIRQSPWLSGAAWLLIRLDCCRLLCFSLKLPLLLDSLYCSFSLQTS